MDRGFITILNMSLTGAFVIAAICLARLPLKKAPKVISYCLWAVAGFRLVFPFSIESVLSLIPFNARTIPTDIATQAVPRINSGITVLNNTVSRVLPAAAPGASANPLQIWTTVGAAVWLAGAAAMLLYGAASFILLKRKMRGAVCAEANVYEAENIKSPFVLGFFKPRIYLPAGLTEREYVLLHERTHIRRRDHIVKLAAYVVLCLHWFNPLAWLAFLLMGADMEMSCDERVLKEAGGKVDYSLSLLSLSTERRSIAGSPLAFGEGGVKERVKNVLKFKKHSRIIIILAVALAAALGVGFAVSRASRDREPLIEMTITDKENPAFWFTEMKLNWGDRVYHVASMRDPQRGREIGYARDEVSEWRIYEIEGYSRDEYLLAVESEDVWRVMSVYPPEEPVKQYILENATRKQQMERLLSVSLYADGTARLATPPISSYLLLPPYYYTFEDDELMIHYERDDVIARFTVIDENTIVFKESSVALFAEEGARYITLTPAAAYEPRKWLDYYYDEQMPWDGSGEITLPEFPGVTFKWTSGTVTATADGKEIKLFEAMPVWNVYFADLNGDALPEICATTSFGSGMVDERVIVYDFANKSGYSLNDRGYYDYTLSLANGRLLVTQTLHSEWGLEERQAVSGELAIQNGELVAIGIDRTIPEIPQNIEPSSPPYNEAFPDISVAESDDDSPGNDFGRKTTVTVRLEDGGETPFIYLGNWNTQIFSEDLFRDGSTALVVLLTDKTSNYLASQIHVLKTDGTTVEEVFTVVERPEYEGELYKKTLFIVPEPDDRFGYPKEGYDDAYNYYGSGCSSAYCTGVRIVQTEADGQVVNALMINHSTKAPAYSIVYFDGSEWKVLKQGSDESAFDDWEEAC